MKPLFLFFSLLLAFSCSHEKPSPEVAEKSVPSTPVVVPVPPVEPTPSTPVAKEFYKPAPNIRYQILDKDHGDYVKQLKNGTQLVVIEAIPNDSCKEGYLEISKKIDKLHDRGVKVSCYHSLSVEPWRCDITSFPASAKGKKMSGWDEWWTDTRISSKAHKFWDNRYEQLAKIGCDCVEDDNEVDSGDNETGFPLSRSDVDKSSEYRAGYAHKLGMCHIAKNNPNVSDIRSKHSDGVMIEEAAKYDEREDYLPWRAANKFAAMIEYSSSGCKPYPGFSVQYHSDGDYFSGVNYKICD